MAYNMNLLVSNIVHENQYSHCRLCLTQIKNQDEFLKFEDAVCIDKENGSFQSLHDLIKEIFYKDKLIEDIPGIDAACIHCVNQAIQCIQFIKMCQKSSETLNRIFDNILSTFDDTEALDIDPKEGDKSLYITVCENDYKCVLIIKEEDNKITHRKPKKLAECMCQICHKCFSSVMSLKTHNAAYHGTLTCLKCHETFKEQRALFYHVQNHHKFQCSQCDVTKSSDEKLQEHIHRAHSDLVCKFCGKSCRGLDNLHIHELKHSKKDQCPKCGKTYTTKGFYMKHVKLCLEDQLDPHPMRGNIVKTFVCDKCEKGYSTEGGLRVHMRFVHGNAKPHVCDYCGKKFTAPSYLKTHLVTHTGEKNFKCDICKNKFVSKEALLYHTRRHTGEKPYSCKICSEKFVNASARAEHIKFRHIGPTLMCEICSRKFVTSHFLKQHMSRHHDPISKLYAGRSMVPPNIAREENMRVVKLDNET